MRDGLKLAWVRGRDNCAIVLVCATAGPSDPAATQWCLVLRWKDCEMSSILLPSDRIWSIGEVLMSTHFKAALGHIRLLAEDDAREQAKKSLEQTGADVSGANAATRSARASGKWSFGLSAAALSISVLAAAVSLYSLNVGLSAHVKVAMQQSTAAASGAGAADLMPEIANLFSDSIRLDANTLGPKGMTLLAEAAARTGFSLNDQGQMVVMFSDPLCPACKQFEEWIAKDSYQTFSPLMVPVALLQGSREAAASVLCATDQVGVWQAVVAGAANTPVTTACADGLAAVDRNNELFAALGFTRTPTFVAMNGAVLVGAKSPQEMAAWAQQNTPQGTTQRTAPQGGAPSSSSPPAPARP